MNKIQVIKYKCCDVVFAACIEPDCYTDKEWLKNMRKYVLRGDTVDLIEQGTLTKMFGNCECDNSTKINNELPGQTNLFEGE